MLQIAPQTFLHDWYARTIEIVDLFQPDSLRLEWGIQAAEFNPYNKQLAAYFHNRAESGHQGVVLTNKGHAYPTGTAVMDIERGSLRRIQPQTLRLRLHPETHCSRVTQRVEEAQWL